jgi:SAM-dependent methyltransferase
MAVAQPAEPEARAIWSRLAAGWAKHDVLHVRHTAGVTARMVDGLQAGQHVLDLACGTGDPTLAAAERVGPTGRVIGVDFIEELLAHARAKAAASGLSHVAFECMDGASLPFPPAVFDRVTIRWGLMFMPDPAACLAHTHRVLVPGGVLSVACWAAPAYNPWATLLPTVLSRHVALPPPPPPGGPSPFALADATRLRALITGAGFTELALDAVELVMDFASGADFVRYRLDTTGPLAELIDALAPAVRNAVLAEVAADAERLGGGAAHLRGVTWLATARR